MEKLPPKERTTKKFHTTKVDPEQLIGKLKVPIIKTKENINNIKNSDLFNTKILLVTERNKNYYGKAKAKEFDKSYQMNYEKYPEVIRSSKINGRLKSFSVNTYVGLIKPDNEDKIDFCEVIKKPADKRCPFWPKMSYFAVFDGHGGDGCSKFLRDNFLNFLVADKNFPLDIKSSFIGAFERAEKEFLVKSGVSHFLSTLGKKDEANSETKSNANNKINVSNIKKNRKSTVNPKITTVKTEEQKKIIEEFDNNQDIDKSGSCACIVLLVEEKIWVANLGDSRAIMSLEDGTKIKPLTIDHKPNNPLEYDRITKCGGKIYIDDENIQDADKLKYVKNKSEFDAYVNDDEIFRIYPSDLAVTRSIGDYKNKFNQLDGITDLISPIPEIFYNETSSSCDFIILGCDGIFDEVSNFELIDAAFYAINKLSKENKFDLNLITGEMCNSVIKFALFNQSVDNLSCIIIGLDNLEKIIKVKYNQDKIKEK